MAAPRWIVDAIEATFPGIEANEEHVSAFARELIDRLPLDRMIRAVATAINVSHGGGLDLRDGHLARLAIESVVATIEEPSEDAKTFVEIYVDAVAALQNAGVPYEIDGNIMSVGNRIRWLAKQHKTSIEISELKATIARLRADRIELDDPEMDRR